MNSTFRTLIILVLGLILLEGCGNQGSDSQVQTPPELTEESVPVVPPTVSIDVPLIDLGLDEKTPVKPQQTAMIGTSLSQVAPKFDGNQIVKGSVEWLIQEISRLKSAPKTSSRGELPGAEQLKSGNQDAPLIHRNHQIIKLAQQILAKTHKKPDQQAFFNSAVHDLADARLQLAIAGDQKQTQLLTEDADVLFKNDPTSYAAAEAAFKVVQFTQIQAQTLAAKEPKWALAFARQARLFTGKFPQETNRAAIHLVAAGRICDKLGITGEAKTCMLLVEKRFPGSPFADQVKNSLRRLRLPGQELLEFGGSTFDGNFISIDQFHGRPVIIAFWASNSVVFNEDMKLIDETVASVGSGATVIGVNLDRDEAAVERFLSLTGNDWPHIFYSDLKKRGAENLVAKYYGVSKVPTYWLIDSQGIVKTVNLKPQELRQWLAQLALAGN